MAAVLAGARQVAKDDGAHGVHVLFADAEEARELEAAGLALRVDFQYHWRNEGYGSPEEFLARFPSKRRNAMRRERAAPARAGHRHPDRARRRAGARSRRVGADAVTGCTARPSTGWCGGCAS